jgi:4-hydroxy-tetrahydrodipicolinate synthase
MLFTGCGTALITPFRFDQSLDEPNLRSLVRRQIENGIDFLVPCGTTGESPTLTHKEHLRVVEITVEEARASARRVPVLAGAGGYNTAEVMALAKELQQIGADGILSVTPYYNKPTQEGLYQHYKAIAQAVPQLPIIVYSVQGRTGVNVEPVTLKRLSGIANIVGVKEASGSITQIGAVLLQAPATFAVLSGDDAMTLPLLSLGGHGLISVAANEIPAQMTRMVALARAGDFAGARAIHREYLDLMDVNFVESNPGPVKAAMSMMGLTGLMYRLPLVEPSEAHQAKIAAVLEAHQLLAGRGAHAD